MDSPLIINPSIHQTRSTDWSPQVWTFKICQTRKSKKILERFGNWQREHGRNLCSPRFGRKEVIPSYLLCTLPYHFGIWSDPRRGAVPAMRGRNSMEQPLIPMFHVMSYHIVCNTTVYIYIIILKWLYIHSCSLHTIIYIYMILYIDI